MGGIEPAVFPGWSADSPGLLACLRRCFAYAPGDDRATGVLYDDEGQDWPLPLRDAGPLLLARLAVLPGVKFQVAAFQAYRDGAGCPWHADTAFAGQAVLSLGVTRTFQARRGADVRDLVMASGDLVFMPAGFQQEWQHRVPEEDAPGERCSLVFRTRA